MADKIIDRIYRIRRFRKGWSWALIGQETIDEPGDGWSEPRPTQSECLEDLRLFREGS